MKIPENIALWTAFAFYLISWVLYLITVIFKKPSLLKWANHLAMAGLVCQTAGLVIRGIATGHLPLFGTFENSQVAAWVLVFVSVFIYFTRRDLHLMNLVLIAAGLLTFIYSLFFNSNHIPLTISERSIFVDIHVIFAWLSFGGLFAAWGMALLILFGKKKLSGRYNYLTENHLYFLAFGFINYTVMLLLGALYEFILFGKYWQWDPVETLSMVCWLLTGGVIHLRIFYPLRIRLAAFLTCLIPVLLFVSYLGLYFLKVQTFHNFDLFF